MKLWKENFLNNKKYYLVAGAILVAAVFLRFFRLTAVPYGIHVDEAGMGYDAFCLANFGVDRYLNRFPVYLVNFGRGQSALYAYLCALCIKIGGGELTTLAMRLPGAVFGILTVIFGSKLVKKYLGQKAALIAMLLLTICPYFIMQSRFGLDCNLLLGMSTVSLYLYDRALEKKRIKSFLLAGVFFGLTLYTYALSYWVLLFFLAFSSIYLLATKKITFGRLVVFAIPIAVLAAPLICFVLVNSLQLEPIVTPFFTIPRLSVYDASFSLGNFFPNFIAILKMLLTKDIIPYNAFEHFFTLYLISIPFVVVGFAIAVKDFIGSFRKKEYSSRHLILLFFFSELLMGCLLGGDGPNINKMNGIYVTLVYFAVLAIIALCKVCKRFHKYIATAVCLLYLAEFGFFCNYYFNQYKTDIFPQYLFENTCQDAITYEEEVGTGVFTFIDYTAQGYIYYLAGSQISPYDAQDAIGNLYYKDKCFSLDGQVLNDCSYIIKKTNTTFLDLINQSDIGYQIEEFGDYLLYYREN